MRYLSLTDVIELHRLIMERTGAPQTLLRDEGLLDSALMRPCMAVHYEEADLIRQAALLAVGISQAQAFVDGNKRAAFAALDVFLRINGSAFTGDPIQLAQELEKVAGRDSTLEEATATFETWLRDNVEGAK